MSSNRMFLLWVRDMGVGRADLQWFKAMRYYASHQHDRVPPVGKYNGGQKLFFWVQSLLGVVLLITGLPLWFPGGFLGLGAFTADTFNMLRLLHYLGSLVGGLFLIGVDAQLCLAGAGDPDRAPRQARRWQLLHIYLGTIAFPGTARGMIDGKVTREWAKLHHPLWHDEVTGS